MHSQTSIAQRWLPFLRWFPLEKKYLWNDLIAGVTVALVLIPQSMAYAQLAGLPPVYGLYASFLPVIFATLFGSSNQLSTGPVAMTSLLTASALTILASPGSDLYIQLAIQLALVAGVIRILMGLLHLGLVVNLLSHPVLTGFTNAAAIIISFSQLSKWLGVPGGHTGRFLTDAWELLQQARHFNEASLFMGLFAFAIIMGFKKWLPRIPGVLVAVILCTVISWKIGFQQEFRAPVSHFADPEIRHLLRELQAKRDSVRVLQNRIQEENKRLKLLREQHPEEETRILAARFEIELLQLELKESQDEVVRIEDDLHRFAFLQSGSDDSLGITLHTIDKAHFPQKTEGPKWHYKKLDGDQVLLIAGGEIVGDIPAGLPQLRAPRISWDAMVTLIPAAFALVLIGFMEAISIAKTISARTREPIDVNQELIGQGVANVVGSFSSAYPVSGSFSRSALNYTMGARTGLSSVVTGIVVMITLLFFTPLLYYLPKAVLAAVIISAVIGLINFKPIILAWKAQRHDGISALATFVATLLFAPHLEMGIYFGAGLTVALYLLRNMTPRVAILGRHPDGTLRDAKLHRLPTCDYIAAVRFDGSLTFVNVTYFEDSILHIISQYPKLRQVLIVCDGINQIDASGVEVIRNVVKHVSSHGIGIAFSGLKKQVLDVLQRTSAYALLGEENIFRTEDQALDALFERVDDPEFDPDKCPLRKRDLQKRRQEGER